MDNETMPGNVPLSEGLGSAVEKCGCGDRAADACPGEWEPGCDMGANPAHVRVHNQSKAERDALDAALGLVRVDGSVWRPIRAAPQDGTPVLVFDPDTEAPQVWIASWLEFEGDPEGGNWTTTELATLTGPSHWMPLPRLPNARLTAPAEAQKDEDER